ncbi:MAG: histidine kinase [Flavobacterium psychrophilum]|nr:MAG: histidine kinase [Flavobacterium psychrophilum]
MENSLDNQIREDKVRKKVKAMQGFYKHLIVYLAINVFLLIIKAINTKADDIFFEWGTFSTAIFWGIGLFFHWYSVFGTDIILGKNWEERKIKEMMGSNQSKESETKRWE